MSVPSPCCRSWVSSARSHRLAVTLWQLLPLWLPSETGLLWMAARGGVWHRIRHRLLMLHAAGSKHWALAQMGEESRRAAPVWSLTELGRGDLVKNTWLQGEHHTHVCSG